MTVTSKNNPPNSDAIREALSKQKSLAASRSFYSNSEKNAYLVLGLTTIASGFFYREAFINLAEMVTEITPSIPYSDVTYDEKMDKFAELTESYEDINNTLLGIVATSSLILGVALLANAKASRDQHNYGLQSAKVVDLVKNSTTSNLTQQNNNDTGKDGKKNTLQGQIKGPIGNGVKTLAGLSLIGSATATVIEQETDMLDNNVASLGLQLAGTSLILLGFLLSMRNSRKYLKGQKAVHEFVKDVKNEGNNTNDIDAFNKYSKNVRKSNSGVGRFILADLAGGALLAAPLIALAAEASQDDINLESPANAILGAFALAGLIFMGVGYIGRKAESKRGKHETLQNESMNSIANEVINSKQSQKFESLSKVSAKDSTREAKPHPTPVGNRSVEQNVRNIT